MTNTALILSHDSVAAALVGAVAELAGLESAFPQRAESAREAIRRLRPACVLADCDRDDVGAEAFIGPAMMMGARVAVFCSSHDGTAMARSRRLAQRYGIAFFQLPDACDRLQAHLTDIAQTAVTDTPRSSNSR